MADDLDSFFQEINQVTAESAFAENSAYDLNADNYDESSATSGIRLQIFDILTFYLILTFLN